MSTGPSFLAEHPKTHSCGELRRADVGKRAVLMGWVDSRRDHGGCVFIDLRDRDGVTRVVFRPEVSKEAHALAGELRGEFCVGIAGAVDERGSNVNPKLAPGEVELTADRLEIVSRAETPPVPIEDGIDTNEALRLKHR